MEKPASIIIPNWNGMKYLETCLNSLRKQTLKEFEIIVVDNGSTDGSVEFIKKNYSEIEVIELPENKGFSVAVNEGIKSSSGEFIVLLNNDTAADPNWLEELYRAIEKNSAVGFAASKALNFDDRNIISSAGSLYTTFGWAWNRGANERDGEEFNSPMEIFGVCAAAAIYRKSMLDEIGLFDEEFFAYYEDVDLNFRAQLSGYKCLYVPTAKIYHVDRGTSTLKKRVFLSRQNSLFVLMKNMPIKLLRKHLFKTIGFQLMLLLYHFLRGESASAIKGWISAWKMRKIMLSRRKTIQRHRKVSDDYIDSILSAKRLKSSKRSDVR